MGGCRKESVCSGKAKGGGGEDITESANVRHRVSCDRALRLKLVRVIGCHT